MVDSGDAAFAKRSGCFGYNAAFVWNKVSDMKLLLVRLSSMGDLIHTLPALTDVQRHRPDVAVDWLCEAAFADVARLHPFVRRVVPMRWRAWRKQLFQAAVRREIGSLKAELQTAAYERVLDSQGLLKSALFARMAAAPVAGLDRHSAREPLAAWLYRDVYAVPKGRDAVWRNRELFAQALGYRFEGAADFGVRVPDAGRLDGLPVQYQYYVALHATSRDSKLWPLSSWLEALAALHAQSGLPVVLPWGNAAERARAEQMAAALPFAQVCPPLNLLQAAFVLQQARAVVGVDTGLLHLADALGRPLVGIYTDSDPHKTGVQPSSRSVNLGGVGQMPGVQAVLSALAQVQQAA